MRGKKRGGYDYGIKLSTNTGFLDNAKENVVEHEGTDLFGFCHADYKFSSFVDRFMRDEWFDPITAYGNGTKEIRTAIQQALSDEPKKKKEKKDRAKIIADSVADNIEQYFAPLRPGNQRQLKLRQSVRMEDMAKILNKMATKGYLTGIKVSKEAMEDLLDIEENELRPLINFAESEITERAQARKEKRKQQREKKNPKKKLKEANDHDGSLAEEAAAGTEEQDEAAAGTEEQDESDAATDGEEDIESKNRKKERMDQNETKSDAESSDEEVPMQQIVAASKGTSSKAVRVDNECLEDEEDQNRKKKRRTLSAEPKEGLRRSRQRTAAD